MRLGEADPYTRDHIGRAAFEKRTDVARDDLFGAPAGWYPDPTGLPQLRWWDNHAWTEQTSAARQPLVMQDAKFAWAEPELPTRRSERERERREEREREAAARPTAHAPERLEQLEQLEPPQPASPTPPRDPLVGTAPAWIIALVPLLQLVSSLLLLTALTRGDNSAVFVGIIAVPYPLVVVLAFADVRLLRKQGVERPAHWAWALLTAPVYLLARARNVIRESGHGIGPVLVWFGLGAVHLASIVAIPGLLIAVLPGVFTSQLEASVESDALLVSGATMSVSCPASPPVIFGEETVCTAVSASGKDSEVSVTLQRANGWIEWRVLDWGVWDLSR